MDTTENRVANKPPRSGIATPLPGPRESEPLADWKLKATDYQRDTRLARALCTWLPYSSVPSVSVTLASMWLMPKLQVGTLNRLRAKRGHGPSLGPKAGAGGLRGPPGVPPHRCFWEEHFLPWAAQRCT